MIFSIKYGRQTVLIGSIYVSYRNHLNNLKLIPIDRKIDKANGSAKTDFSAYGYSIYLPWDKELRISENDVAKIGFTINNIGIIIKKPEELPINSYQLAKSEDIKLFNYLYADKFHSNFEFIKSSFYSRPSIWFVFKSLKEVNLLHQQQTTKVFHLGAPNNYSGSIYLYNCNDIKIFQVGDPSVSNIVRLWVYPDQNKEIEIMVISKNSNMIRQDDIDVIINSIREKDVEHNT